MKAKSIAKSAFIAMAVLLNPDFLSGAEPPNDPVSLWTLKFIREHGHYMDGVRFPKEHPYWTNLQRYRDQGAAVRPALMYLLTDEYRGNYGKMADVVSSLENAPGDQTELLDFVRAELARRPEPRPEGYRSFLTASVSALSTHGNRNDLPLIQGFQSDNDVSVRLSAERHAQNLEQRIAKKADGPMRQPRDPVGQDDGGSSRNNAEVSRQSEADAGGGKSAGAQWAAWGAGGLLVVALVIYFALRRGDI